AAAAAAAPAAGATSLSPPPAELEATCLRCTISAVGGLLADSLSDELLSLGAQSVVLQEHRPPGAPEQEIFDDGQSRELWELCDLVAHFALEADVAGTLALAADALELPAEAPLVWEVKPVANEEWVEQIMASYVPLQLAPDLWVIPEWSQPEDLAAVNIILQPGVAFGTGEHPTTRLCLLELRALAAGGQLAGCSLLDYGTGSGVLAIAALKYGALRAVSMAVWCVVLTPALRGAWRKAACREGPL
ncbi:Ribosomal protein L11 methyltransferase, partial [Tetrabaena socialis]